MGYFSNLSLEKEEQYSYKDHSYPSPEMQLEMRIEDLFCRLEELQHGCFDKSIFDYGDCRLSRTDLEYALPESISSVDDIITAIALAKLKLQRISEEYQQECAEKQEKDTVEIPGQITIWEYEEKDKEARKVYLLAVA